MKEIIEELVELIESAIKAKDWKVDGVCDPTMALIRAKNAIQDGDCQRCGGKGCIACDARKQKREWVGLTLKDLPDEHYGNVDFGRGANWAEAMLRSKNT